MPKEKHVEEEASAVKEIIYKTFLLLFGEFYRGLREFESVYRVY
jgi:hypothetical protein